MKNTDSQLSAVPSRGDLEAECGPINYTELQTFFAKGRLVSVAPALNLVDVAWAMAQDNAQQLSQWVAQGLVERAHDGHARRWLETNACLQAVTVTPWILVQDTEWQ